jgi:hypothetical protein
MALVIVLVLLLGLTGTGMLVFGYLYFASLPSEESEPRLPRLLQQTGKFRAISKEQGEVYFPIPYNSPPNVVLEGPMADSTLTPEVRRDGFKWKDTGKGPFGHQSADMTWKAKGLRPPNLPR